jgi:hypothetical protein
MLRVGGIPCRDRSQMAQADWASGILLRRLLSVVVAEGSGSKYVFRLTILSTSPERLRISLAGRAHGNWGSNIKTIHLAFALASTPVVSLLRPYRTFVGWLRSDRKDEDEHCRISIIY